MKDDVLSTELTDVGTCGAYVVEASEVRGRFVPASRPTALVVRSAITGARWAYHVAHVDVDPDGDVRFWDLEPTHAGLPKITIFNT